MKRYYDIMMDERVRALNMHKNFLNDYENACRMAHIKYVPLRFDAHIDFKEAQAFVDSVMQSTQTVAYDAENVRVNNFFKEYRGIKNYFQVVNNYCKDILNASIEDMYYDGLVFSMKGDNIWETPTVKPEDFYAAMEYIDRPVVIEVPIKVRKFTYYLGMSLNIMYKHENGTGTKYISCETNAYQQWTKHNLGNGGFVHLSTVVFKPGSDSIWVSHADENLARMDTATIVLNDKKLKCYRGDVAIINFRDFDRDALVDGWLYPIIISAVMGTARYYQNLCGERKSIIISGEKKRRPSVPTIHGNSMSVLNKYEERTEYIPIEEVNVRKSYVKKAWQGGHHATPRPHDVSGHDRHYKNGKVVHIDGYHKDCDGYVEKTTRVNKVVKLD